MPIAALPGSICSVPASPDANTVESSRSDDDVRAWLLQLPDDQLREVLAPREIEAMDFGLRERVTDVHKPHIRDLPERFPASSRPPRGARRRPASTASSSTTRTRTRWRRFSPLETRGRTATGVRVKTA